MVSGQLSALLLDWAAAVTELNISIAHKLLEKEPELLWTPIPQSLDDLDHLRDHLVQLTKLGTSFQPVSAIQFTVLHYGDNHNDNRFKFLSYLIEQSSLHDLDTRFWGECNNSTLHLVCFLGHQQIVQLLIEKGVSVTPSNELGFMPKDVIQSSDIQQLITAAAAKQNKKSQLLDRSKTVRPNYSTPDRFKLLRELAEESSGVEKKSSNKVTVDRKKSEGHYFRKGRVKETQRKVLTEEEVVELEKQRQKRQLEVAQLVKKSAVKNNPLFKKLEKRSYTSPTPSPSNSSSMLATEESDHNTEGAAALQGAELSNDQVVVEEPVIVKPKRNSKVITSLQTKSYVSSSIFVQADEVEPKHNTTKPIPTLTINNRIPSQQEFNINNTDDDSVTMFHSQEDICVTKQSLSDNEGTTLIISTEPDEMEEEDDEDNYTYLRFYQSKEEHNHVQTSDEEGFYEANHNNNNSEELIAALGVATTVGNDKGSTITVTYPPNVALEEEQHTTVTTSSDDDYSDNDDDDNDDEFEEATPVQFATRLVSPIYKSVVILSEEEKNSHLEERKQKDSSLEQLSPTRPQQNDTETTSSLVGNLYSSSLPSSIEIARPRNYDPRSSSLININGSLASTEEEEEPVIIPVRPQRSELRRGSNNSNNNNGIPIMKQIDKESKEKKRMSGSQKAAWTMSMSSWAAILDREFNLDELDPDKKLKQQQQLAADKILMEEESNSGRPSIDYLGASKIQLSDDELDIVFGQHGSTASIASTLQINKIETPSPPPRRHQPPPPSINTTPLPRAPQIEEIPRLQSTKSISRKPIAASLSESTVRSRPVSNMNINSTIKKPTKQHSVPASINIKHRGDHGKLYLHVNGIQDILLPLPKERAYVRCVVSDGRFEYMSRYEILSQNINFDYECVIDTHPDMIITISLHVRPDYVMKSRKPFSRLFSSKKKKKESLSGYVNKEDGAIGQARFALAHMLPVCIETTYLAGFHCFNAWYSRSFKERHRQKKQDPDQDVLKVVGNFDVEMLYLPVQDYNKPFPRNLRECDMAIKQLHRSVEDSSERYHTF